MAQIANALQHPFSYTPQAPISWLSQIFHRRDPSFHERNISSIAEAAIQAMASANVHTPREADAHPLFDQVRAFLKSAESYSGNSAIKKCERAFLAFKLAISPAVLEANPDFERYARKAHLERPLVTFDHSLSVYSSTICFHRQGGALEYWGAAKQIAERQPAPITTFAPPEDKYWRGYGEAGVVSESPYGWNVLKPFRHIQRGSPTEISVCSFAAPWFRLAGDHSWLEWNNRAGEVYNPGLYRETNDKMWTACKVQRAQVQDNDVSGVWRERTFRVTFPITDAQAALIKTKVENDHNGDRVLFQVSSDNCTKYALGLLELANIKIDAKGSLIWRMMPHSVYKQFIKIDRALPAPLQKIARVALAIIHYLPAVMANIFLALFLGGTKISDKIPEEQRRNLKPHYASILDIFDPSKVMFDSPYVIAYGLDPKEIARLGGRCS